MKRILFVRHGESVANAGGVTMENAAIPLSDHGRRQAEAIAEWLPGNPALVLVSPMLRAQQTAAPYCRRHGVQPAIQPLLAEFSVICPTLIAGLSGDQRRPHVESYWAAANPNQRMGPGADTFHEFDSRVSRFVERLPDLPDGTRVFGHGLWFALLLWQLQSRPKSRPTMDAAGMLAFRRFQQALSIPNGAAFSLQGGSR